ncbi:MAG: hypothetical protein IT460_05355 [Planctomycetes bacterium]|nr:hypothetical protein [Planctomycetota bacterium]
MAPGETVFRFAAEGIDLEFAGSEEFVEKQLARFQPFLRHAVGGGDSAPAASPAAPSAPSAAPKESLEAFYAARPLREGRGAIQDRILLFIHYLQHVQGKREVSGDDIVWCFQQLGIPEPKNLHNALGILKRKIGHLQEGSKRGLYSLSPEGITYVEGRFRTR